YVGGFSGTPPLSQLGGARWKNQKEKVAESVKDLAASGLWLFDVLKGIGYTLCLLFKSIRI
ncbi:MAG: hypothetical protein RLN96_03895, partial [Pseudomonadales bacterium]